MNDSSQLPEAEALEGHIRAITEAADRAAVLLRALAPLRPHLAALDAAVAAAISALPASVEAHVAAPAASAPAGADEVADLQMAPGTPGAGDLKPARDDSARPELSSPGEQTAVPTAAGLPSEGPAAVGLMAVANADGEANGATAPAVAHLGRTITVTVTREDAPLDLVRVHSALDQVQGVLSLALVSYTRGRAVLQIEGDRPIDEMRLTEGLRAAFPEGVTTHRQSPDDLVLSIGTP